MYETHFGLKQRPFRALPDNELYYPATSHERVLARLLHAVNEDEGFILLTGDPGSGKTLLCNRLLEKFVPEVTSIFLTNTHIRDRASLFQAILFDLSLPYEGRSEQELRLTLTEFLLKNYEAGRRAVLVIDEAQHLGADLLEELRLLGNLEVRYGKALQVVLSAQPGIMTTLAQTEMTALSQRIVTRIRLEPLGVHEAADYIVHQLRAAGGKPEKLIADEALDILARGTHGSPRRLNQAAHQAMSLAQSTGVRFVDAEVALEALAVLGLGTEEPAELGETGERLLRVDQPERIWADDVVEESSAQKVGIANTSGEERLHHLFIPPRRPA